MSQETLNIIIGALIGFVPSALVALVAHFLQVREKKMERERQIKKDRIDEIEHAVTEALIYISTVPSQLKVPLDSLHPEPLPVIDDSIKDFENKANIIRNKIMENQKIIESMESIIFDIWKPYVPLQSLIPHINPVALLLEDKILDEKLDKFIEIIMKYLHSVTDAYLLEDRSKRSDTFMDAVGSIIVLQPKLFDLYVDILKKLDYHRKRL